VKKKQITQAEDDSDANKRHDMLMLHDDQKSCCTLAIFVQDWPW